MKHMLFCPTKAETAEVAIIEDSAEFRVMVDLMGAELEDIDAQRLRVSVDPTDSGTRLTLRIPKRLAEFVDEFPELHLG
jgi:hypothetical protein